MGTNLTEEAVKAPRKRTKRTRLPARKTYTGPQSLRHITRDKLASVSLKTIIGVVGYWLWPGREGFGPLGISTPKYACEIYADNARVAGFSASYVITDDFGTRTVETFTDLDSSCGP